MNGDRLVELPAPTASPAIAAIGVTLLCAGLVTHPAVSAVGAVMAIAGFVGWFREVLPHEHVAPEVQLRLEQNHPSFRVLAVKGPMDVGEERTGCVRVRQRRPRERVEIAIEHFGDEVLRNVAQVVVRGAFLQGFHL